MRDDRIGCGVLLLAETAIIAWLVVTRTGVFGHDAFQYFGLQFYFLCDSATSGENALWMPFMTHGTLANWWFYIQTGFSQSLLLLAGTLKQALLGWNFHPLFYGGILFDHVVLLVGVVAYGRRMFRNGLSVIFTAVAVVGTAVWYSQPWWNFHAYYLLPLLFHLVHAAAESSGRGAPVRYAILIVFVALACFGNMPYWAPVILLALSAYALPVFVAHRRDVPAAMRRPAVLLSIIASGLIAIAVTWIVLTGGTSEIINYTPGRKFDGTAPLFFFLNYGRVPASQWIEMLTGFSPAFDCSLYAGVLAIPCIFYGIWSCRSRLEWRIVAASGALFFLMSSATVVATALYHVWPGMAYYRHLGLMTPVVKLYLCLAAGFGFDAFVDRIRTERVTRQELLAAIAFFIVVATGLAALLATGDRLERILSGMFIGGPDNQPSPLDIPLFDTMFLDGNPARMITRTLVVSVALAAVASVLAAWRRHRVVILMALVAVHAADAYSYKLQQLGYRSQPLTAEQYALSTLRQLPWHSKRVDPIRLDEIADLVPQIGFGETYWSLETFLMADPLVNAGRTDHWLKPYDRYLRAMHGESASATTHATASFRPFSSIIFPDRSAARMVSGGTEGKVLVYSRAHELDEAGTAKAMQSSGFNGEVLFIDRQGTGPSGPVDGTAVERARLPVRNLLFTANQVGFEVHAPGDGMWLYYADVWHPFWTASVNDVRTPVRKADLAYKAVPLRNGRNVVTFSIRAPWLAAACTVINLLYAAGAVAVVMMFGALMRRPPYRDP